MRRTAVVTLVAVLVSMGGTTVAQADTPRCVSRHEFNRINKGMPIKKVHRIFDIRGKATGLGLPNELRYYRTCTGRGVVQVVFSPQRRVVSKDARFF